MSHRNHLAKDKKIARLMAAQETYLLKKQKNIALQLCLSILSQQLSIKVAAVFHQRFMALFNNSSPSPRQVAALSFDTLRSIGLSKAKATYIKNVADYFMEHRITDNQLHKMTDDEVIDLLTKIKGVGKWTVEMILMFSLQREDVFSCNDLGIRQAMCSLYNINGDENKKQVTEKMLRTAHKWKPYRTYACLYLWGWKDNAVKSTK